MQNAKVIDVHSHCIPEKLVELVKKENNPYNASLFIRNNQQMVKMGPSHFPLSPTAVNPGDKLKSMDEMGLDHSVLSLSPRLFGYDLGREEALYCARVANEGIAELVGYMPERLSGMATIPLKFMDEAVQELERSASNLDLIGVEIGTHLEDMNLDNEYFYPLYEAAEALDLLVLIHPYMTEPDIRMKKYYFNNLLGMTVNTSISLASIIFGGILDRFPDLKLLFCHGGGFIPYQFGRLNRGYQIRDEIKNTCQEKPSSYLNRVYYDTITHHQDSLRYLVETVGSEQVVIGTDHPFDMGDNEPLTKLNLLKDITEKERTDILYQNARNIFPDKH